LSIAAEIFSKLKDFNPNNCIIRLNHMSLVQGILMYSGIERARHFDICSYFARFRVKNICIILPIFKCYNGFTHMIYSKMI